MKWISIFTITCVLAATAHAFAEDAGHPHADQTKSVFGSHGGHIHKVNNALCEVVFRPRSIRVYLYDGDGKPISARQCRGTITLRVDRKPKSFRYDLYPESTRDAAENSLYLPINLSHIKNGKVSTSFSIVGVPGTAVSALAFSQPFSLTPSVEELAIARQKICLVSGKPLGSMGQPIKTTANGQTVYVCCAGCKKPLQANPKKYLAKLTESANRQTR